MPTQEDVKREGNRLYQQFGTPLEVDHRGEYVAIAPDGRVVLAPTPVEALVVGDRTFGPGNFIFKVGERIVVRWR